MLLYRGTGVPEALLDAGSDKLIGIYRLQRLHSPLPNTTTLLRILLIVEQKIELSRGYTSIQSYVLIWHLFIGYRRVEKVCELQAITKRGQPSEADVTSG